ncbi:MAG: hypothetical protein JWM89_901 [Acidimicrobiales bacterium]|nr:hypothetical protein [Acidimicrobiales bacterium]
MKRRPKTAGEFLEELEADPAHQDRQEAWAVQEAENRRRYHEAARGLLDDLTSLGYDVSSMAELRSRGFGERRVTPVLIKWLSQVTYPPLKSDIIVTLGMPWAKDAAGALIEEFDRTDPDGDPAGGVRWAIGDSLERIADDRVADDLLRIAADQSPGSQRGLAVAALGRLKRRRPEAIALLVQLLDDPDVAGYAIMGLARTRAVEARDRVTPFLDHPEGWIRREAKNALPRLGS